ncbi:flavin containing amine oxidoreductase [Colletotrichum truncatum]|uniref:Flavin containing amine oxidoreductase n=1 Tax=Colletotrichum truncatum TaxID=5467 RepID=A0ACC3YYJ6_COLTU|nr:flavin containing amine oxidoreductase [Colletotrichum truncatum]KAF6782076.1 flavin containing amine oxidoreductase [Colletotrichum truncatum]
MTPNEPLPGDCARPVEPNPYHDSYKAQWARYVARHKLQRDLEVAGARISKAMSDGRFKTEFPSGVPIDTVAALAKITEIASGGGLIPETHGHFKVSIVGSGVAGLFTAMLFDWINEQLGKDSPEGNIKIDYDILEAAGEDRFGGRLYTHSFYPHGVHDYYDVGAMRFPENDVMTRTFQLFKLLGIEKGKLGDRKSAKDDPVLVPYYLKDDKGVCPSYFNDVRHVGNPYGPYNPDPWRLNEGIPKCDQIPAHILQESPDCLFERAIDKYLQAVKRGLDDRKKGKPPTPEEEEKFWNMLRLSDQMSTRQFLLSVKNPGDIPDGPGYSYNTVQWMETATYGTGWYDQSLTEAVLEALDFNTQDGENWWCVDGGAQKIAEKMRDQIKKPNAIKYNTQVTGIKSNVKVQETVTREMTLSMKEPISNTQKTDENYLAVFNSTTLGSMNNMNLSEAGLFWDTKQAIKCLGYGASCKVGMKFRSAWWRKAPFNITQGGLARTDLPLQVCVYPSYNIEDPIDEPAVLLVSYTWGQTAQRIASLISSDTPYDEEELRDVLIRDLALLHAEKPSDPESYNRTFNLIKSEYMTHHAWDWYRDRHMAGAFAYFGPCQFWDLYPAITKPNSSCQLYFVGEAASAHHAWVVGALESVVRAAWFMFDSLHQGSKNDKRRGGEAYKPYKDAMTLLEKGFLDPEGDEAVDSGHPNDGPNREDLKLPFYPLPMELPKRCDIESDKHTKIEDLVDHPQFEKGKEVPILYGAAVVALSMVESTLDNVQLFGAKRAS